MIPPRPLALGSAVLLLAGLSAGVPRPVERRDEKEVERLLSLPISPGSVALLVEDSRLPAVADRWTAALADPRPAVRGAAARAINVTGLVPLRPALEQALRAEDVADAAREEIRALATIAGGEGRPLLLETASRFDGRLDAALFETLARTAGRAALPVYFSSPKPRLTPAERRGFFTVASQGDAATLAGVGSMALGRQDRPSWNAVLEAANGLDLDLEPSVLGVALASPDAEIAADTAWRLASRCSMRPCPAADALRSALETQKPWANIDEHFSRELLARALGGSARESAEWIDSLASPDRSRADGLTSENPALRLLTRAELAALNRRRRTIAGITTPLALRAPSPQALRQDRHIRTLSGLPRGLTADVLSIIGCSAGIGAVGGAEITYGADGRPRSVKLVDAHAPAACSRAARSLFMLSLSPSGQLSYPGEPDVVVAAFQPDCAAAFDELASAATPGDGPLPVGGAVQAPVLTKKTEPLYPEEARKERVSGLVVLEAVVDEGGCVNDVRVIRNADPRLDLAALYAVARWRYAPATLRGEPVRVFLTVTVTFKAH